MSSTSELLLRIESKCGWLRQDAKMLADSASMISQRRDFPTLAEEGLDLAERELIDALATVRRARAAYLSKPLESAA